MAEVNDRNMNGQRALLFLGVACAVGVASIYLNQPLLVVMGHSLHAPPAAMGLIAVATQIGYAVGILCFVPLGDVAERRVLMMRMYAGVTGALLLAGLAPGFAWLLLASVLIGGLASVTHVALPIAPDLVPSEKRGQAIGTVMTGLLLGILLARSFAGWLSRFSGWRSVFLVAAGLNLLFVPILYRIMPPMPPRQTMRYSSVMRSLWTLFRAEPLLRESATLGALSFASFSCFWTTLAFLLQEHYGMGPAVAGTFGIVGAAGALVAPFAGRLSDRYGTRFVVSAAGAVLTASYILLWAAERAHLSTTLHMTGLFLGVIVLDTGAQMMQVANQTRIFGLDPAARSRINTIYMTSYFAGGAAGSALASVAWAHWRWNGVCALALSLVALAGLRQATGYSRTLPRLARNLTPAEHEPA